MKWTGSAFALAAWLALATNAAWGASPRLAWDPNPPEEGVTGYTVYWGPVSRHAPEFRGYEDSSDTLDTLYTLPLPENRNTLYFATVVLSPAPFVAPTRPERGSVSFQGGDPDETR